MMPDHRTFSAREALHLLGKEVRSRLDRDGIPRNARGRVIWIRRGGRCASGFSVALRWHASGQSREEELTKPEFECYAAIDPIEEKN